MPNAKYITVETFDNMVTNQTELICILNHNMTDLTSAIKLISEKFESITEDVSTIKGKFLGISLGLKWIGGVVGIIATLIAIGVALA